MTAVRSFLLAILPAGVEVFQAQQSRLPEPTAHSFVVLTPIMRERLSTNVDVYADVSFSGSVSGNILTVTAVQFGAIAVGAPLFGAGVAAGSIISALGTGTGGVGTYTLSAAQTGVTGPLAAGVRSVTQSTRITVQSDIHSADVATAANMAQTVSTLFRDEFAVDALSASNANISPLFASDPHQVPFLNSEQQYESRWIVDLVMDANMAIDVPQDFASAVTVNFISADNTYPA